MDRKSFIDSHRNLFWYTPKDKVHDISDALLVETILNYGTMNDIRSLIDILGIKRTSEVFYSAKGRQKSNYYPEIYNYFNLYFKKYAQ